MISVLLSRTYRVSMLAWGQGGGTYLSVESKSGPAVFTAWCACQTMPEEGTNELHSVKLPSTPVRHYFKSLHTQKCMW